MNMPWLPRADGVFLTDHPQKLVQQKKIANIPYIIGITFYSCVQLNDLI
jgi:acetylcholinesterase